MRSDSVSHCYSPPTSEVGVTLAGGARRVASPLPSDLSSMQCDGALGVNCDADLPVSE